MTATAATLVLAVYGALVSSLLAVLRIHEFIVARRLLEIREQVSFSSEDGACYRFMISNVSSGDITIVDLMVGAYVRRPSGKLEEDWAQQPRQVDSLWPEDESEKAHFFASPLVLKSGGTLFIEISENELRESFALHRRIATSIKKRSDYCNQMFLEIDHSRSANPAIHRFKLKRAEHLHTSPVQSEDTDAEEKFEAIDLPELDDSEHTLIPEERYLYAVRSLTDQQPIGFFWVTDDIELWDLVDSVTDPGMCEYRAIDASTGIVWEGPESWKLGIRHDKLLQDESGEKMEQRMKMVRRGMSFDGSFALPGSLSSYIDGSENIMGWTKLPYANEPGSSIYHLANRDAGEQ
jgi:hypothetical protein